MPLSEKGEQAVLNLFKMFDKNKNGVIEKSEQKDAEKLLHSMVLPKARWKLTDMDTDSDGKISSSEWLDAMQKLADASAQRLRTELVLQGQARPSLCQAAGEAQLLEGLVRAWEDHPLTASLKALEEASELQDAEDPDAFFAALLRTRMNNIE